MNDHQLLCFLTVSRTLNFTTAAPGSKAGALSAGGFAGYNKS